MTKLVIHQVECKSKSIRDIATLMENDLFRNFFNKYMQNWQDIETMIMFMKVYQAFEESVLPLIGSIHKNDKKKILSLMTERSIHDLEFRKNICENMQTFIKGRRNLKLLDLQTYIVNK